jgi:hypothetical protein
VYAVRLQPKTGTMKKLLVIAFTACTLITQAQVKMPQPSTTQTISQDFGLGKLELNYSRPGLKGREAFGKQSLLAPLDSVWRTGANGATTLNVTDEVTINGVTLKAGKYGILSIPGKKDWTIIITKDVNITQPSMYKKENDLVRYTAPAIKMSESVETFTMQFANVQNETCELHLMWGKTAVSLPISTNIKDRIKAEMDKAMQGDKPPYFAAANFYYEWLKDYNTALQHVTKAIEASPNAFWMFLLKAKIHKDMGDKVAAKAAAEQCIKLATAAGNNDYVRSSTDLISKL